MRKLLNTLYITTPNAYLCKEGLNLVIRVDNEETFRIPVHNLEAVVTFSYNGASPGAMLLCLQNHVALTFLSPNGHFIGHLVGETYGNVLLRKTQYRIADDEAISLNLSRNIIATKISNSKYVLERYIRDYGFNADISEACLHLKNAQSNALKTESIASLRGIEGDAASCYFNVFGQIIRNPTFNFHGRNKRPPKDPVNAMLSFCYSLLSHEVQAALETVGLDPYVGFMHRDRPGRPSLALDIMEDLRSYISDRFVVTLINRGQITEKDFVIQSNISYVMTDNARKKIITAWQKRKKDTITHPFLGEKIPFGLIPYAQAMLLSRYIRGDLENYPTFFAK